MSLDALIMFSGALAALTPFLGFPNAWDAVFFLILGMCIVCLGVIVRRRRKTTPRVVERTEQRVSGSVQSPVHD